MVCLKTLRGNASFYKWRPKYGGMDASMVSRMKAIDRAIGTPLVKKTMARENRRLMRMYADLSMQADLLNCEGERHWSERT